MQALRRRRRPDVLTCTAQLAPGTVPRGSSMPPATTPSPWVPLPPPGGGSWAEPQALATDKRGYVYWWAGGLTGGRLESSSDDEEEDDCGGDTWQGRVVDGDPAQPLARSAARAAKAAAARASPQQSRSSISASGGIYQCVDGVTDRRVREAHDEADEVQFNHQTVPVAMALQRRPCSIRRSARCIMYHAVRRRSDRGVQARNRASQRPVHHAGWLALRLPARRAAGARPVARVGRTGLADGTPVACAVVHRVCGAGAL
jgi:hypothetical protein